MYTLPVVGALDPNMSLHVPGFVNAYRNHPDVDARFGTPVPFSVAVLIVMFVAAVVVAVGGAGIVKVCTEPHAVPSGFDAMAQK
jgi:hypothetical protein